MKKLSILAASVVLAAATIAPAFAQIPTTATTSKVTAGQVKAMPPKAKASIHATIKKVVKKPVTKKPMHKVPAKATPSANATSTVR